jgi:hypothetical protein
VSRLVSRLTATTVAAGALLAAAALPAAAADHSRHPGHDRSQVILGDVHQGGDRGRDHGRDDVRDHRRGDSPDEWISVVNTGRRSVDLAGWTLSDEDHHSYRFGHLWLGAHDSVRVHTGFGRDTRTDVYQDRRGPLWQHDDTAILRDDRGRVVDTESWGDRDHRH